jgi:glycosyltransferase involved in cell wall biosynthesis
VRASPSAVGGTDPRPTAWSARVGVVSPGYPPEVGGIEVVVASLAAGLARLGHDVEVLAHRPAGWRRSTLPPAGPVRVRRYADWTHSRRFRVAPGLWRDLARDGDTYDVLHAHGFHASAALAAATMTGRPLVFSPHFHGAGHTALARAAHVPYDRLAGRIFDRSHTVVCVSRAEAELLCEAWPEAREKLSVVPNGVDRDAIVCAQPVDVGRPVILVGGRLERYKQTDLAIRALPLLKPDPMVAVTGTGPEQPRLKRLAVELGVEDRVRFLGALPNDQLRGWQRAASVVVTMSRHEAFGLALLEGALAGAQIVASDIPAHRELSGRLGQWTTLVPPSASPSDLAAALADALESPTGGPRLFEVATWDDVASQTATLYRRAVDETP